MDKPLLDAAHGGLCRPLESRHTWETPLPSPTVIEEDNNDAPPPTPECFDSAGRFCIESGNWSIGTFDTNYCVDARYMTNDPGGQVRWEPTIGPGYYDVYAWWQEDQGGGQDAAFGIYGQVDTTVYVDQSRSQDAGYWNYLGTFPFAPGSGVRLFSDATTGEVVLADGIRWIYHAPYEPLPTPTPVATPTPTPTPTLLTYSYVPWLPRFLTPVPPGGGNTPLPTPGGSGGYPPPYPPPPTETPTPWPTATPTPGDGQPPQSRVDPLPEYRNGLAGFAVNWSGTDPGGSGINVYDVQYKDGAGAWVGWLLRTSLHGRWFTPVQDAHTYYFRARARDRSGNWEDWPANPDYDASTTVDLTAPASSAAAPTYDNASPIPVSWAAADATSGVASTALWYRFDGGAWTASGLRQGGTAGTFNFAPPAGDGTYYLATVATDNAGNQEAVPTGSGDDSTIYDTARPSSAVTALPACSPGVFEVSWAGTDPSPGSGIQSYDVQTCTVDCAIDPVWVDWLTGTTQTTAAFSGVHDRRYYFRSRARDHAGNQENYDKYADASTVVDTIPPATAVNALPLDNPSTTFTVTWGGSDVGCGLDHYDIYYRDESAATWTGWQMARPPYQTSASFTGVVGHTYYFCSRGVDRAGNAEACPPLGMGDGEWPIQGDTETRIRPWSRVNALPAETQSRTFRVTWSGAPGLGPVYDVQVRDGFFGTWQNWKVNFAGTWADYTGQYGHIYCFRSRQKAGGIWEVYPYNYDAYTKLIDVSLGGPLPPAPALVVPPDEAPDRMEEVTRTQVLGTPVVGDIAPAGDVDWYRFELTTTLRVRVRLADLPADYDLYVFDRSGQFRWASTWGRLLPEEVVVRVPAGVYYVRLEGYAGAWSGATPYRLLVERVPQ
jgi:hypothetical protein